MATDAERVADLDRQVEAVTCRLADDQRVLRDRVARVLGEDGADQFFEFVAATAALQVELRSLRAEIAGIGEEIARDGAA
jgi:hypothetical protein